MELRVLEYFLAVTREHSITGAARALHLSQPTLSRQLMDLEKELGKRLFIRSNRAVTLTEEGILLRKRAEEILSLVRKTEEEISLNDSIIAGDLRIGAAETNAVRQLVQTVQQLRAEHPLINLHIISGDKTTVLDDLDHGIIDFALLIDDIDELRYNSLTLTSDDRYGVLMREDDPLAEKDCITPAELCELPLIVSRQLLQDRHLPLLFAQPDDALNIVGSYNLLFNGSLMVEEGLGYAICLEHIVNTSGDSRLCFRPLATDLRPTLRLIWLRQQVFSKAASLFLQTMQEKAAN